MLYRGVSCMGCHHFVLCAPSYPRFHRVHCRGLSMHKKKLKIQICFFFVGISPRSQLYNHAMIFRKKSNKFLPSLTSIPFVSPTVFFFFPSSVSFLVSKTLRHTGAPRSENLCVCVCVYIPPDESF